MGHCRIPHRMHLGTPTSVSEDFPPTSSTGGGSLDIDKIFKELLLLCT